MKKTSFVLGGVSFLTGVLILSSMPMASADPIVDSQKAQTTLNAQNGQNGQTTPVKKGHRKGRRHHQQTNATATSSVDQTK